MTKSEIPSSGVFEEFENLDGERENLTWSGSFREYFEMAVKNPNLVRTSHSRLYGAVTSSENFFTTGENALYGEEKATQRLVDTLNAGAFGLEPSKRILLFMGPPGSGKSTLVNALKRGLEEYTKTDEGVTYAISDCPMHEDPVHLVPDNLRAKVFDKYNIKVEGDLCPHCRAQYGEKSFAERGDIKVERIVFSEKDRIGIGTFKPSDPKSQDITELVGSVDFAKLPEYGTASDPRAYRFDGELNVANRGMIELVEMLKVDERFLYALIDLATDKVIKAPRFANISADEVICAHTNETEYKNYVSNDKNEAMRDRIIVIPLPYNLRVSDEVKIYEKLIGQRKEKSFHISPQTLRIAAIFAVLSRLEPSKKKSVKPMQKLKLYDGEQIAGSVSQKDLKELQEEFPREGMSGISPRYVIDSLSTASMQNGKQCLTPIDAIRAIKDNLDFHPHTRDMKPDDKAKIKDYISEVKGTFDEMATKEVQAAFVYAYEEAANSLCDNYLNNVEAYCNGIKMTDPITDEEIDPDEKLMEGIEEQIGVSSNGKKEFRQQVWNRVATLIRKGIPFDWKSHERLKDAIEKKLFADLKDVVKLTTSAKVPNEEQQGKINEVQQNLIKEKGYCDHCSGELIKYVGRLLAK